MAFADGIKPVHSVVVGGHALRCTPVLIALALNVAVAVVPNVLGK